MTPSTSPDGPFVRGGLSRRRALGLGAAALAAAAVGAGGLAGCGLDRGELAGGRHRRVRYGDHPRQVADLWLPVPGAAADRRGPPFPVAVLVGGAAFGAGEGPRDLVPIAGDLVRRGVAVLLVDHRVLGDGGGWPGTFLDVSRAVDRLADLADVEPLDTDRVVGIGHDTGATLLLWSAARASMPADRPAALPADLAPAVSLRAVVSLAGFTSLGSAAFEGLGQGAVAELLGGPPDPEGGDAYTYADPVERLPLGVAQLLVAAEHDQVVPLGQATAYAARAADAGDVTATLVVPGAGHLDLLDPAGSWWGDVQDWLAPHLARA